MNKNLLSLIFICLGISRAYSISNDDIGRFATAEEIKNAKPFKNGDLIQNKFVIFNTMCGIRIGKVGTEDFMFPQLVRLIREKNDSGEIVEKTKLKLIE